MGRMCVAGHQNFGCKELEECGIKWGRIAGNSEEGQGPQRAVAPMMMMMKSLKTFFSVSEYRFHFFDGFENLIYSKICNLIRFKQRMLIVLFYI
jgi:hypothetical protein